MDMTNIAAAGLQNGMPEAYSMALLRKAMGTEASTAVRELKTLMPPTPAVPKGKYLDVYA